MSHHFVFRVSVDVDRTEGKFVSREAISDELLEAIEGADPGTVDIDETSYSTSSWDVEDCTDEEKKRTKKQSLRQIKLHGEKKAPV